MIFENEICVTQRTFDWFFRRMGRITASDCGLFFSEPRARADKGKLTKAQESYVFAKATERVQLQNMSVTQLLEMYNAQDNLADRISDVARGVNLESEALQRYKETSISGMSRSYVIDTCGFFIHKAMPYFGASPDGIFYDPKDNSIITAIEIKCPRAHNHYETISKGKVKDGYYYQMMAQSLITGAGFSDYVSYCRDVPIDHQIVVITHSFADSDSNELLEKVDHFNTLIELQKEKLLNTKNPTDMAIIGMDSRE